MSLTITSDLITGEHTAHTAGPVPGHPHAWQVSWLPGRLVDRNTAIAAMVLADIAARDPHPGQRIWPFVQGWAAELDLTAPDAIALAAQPQAARLMEYSTARGTSPGPVGLDFGAACHQIDRADLMLADLHDRLRRGPAPPQPAWPETDGPRIIALARRDPHSQTVSLILDAATADTVMFAVAAHAGEREAHVREVQRYGQNLPDGSWGQRNRQAIAAREARVATRLRAIEHAYRSTADHSTAVPPPEPARACRPVPRTAGREIELE